MLPRLSPTRTLGRVAATRTGPRCFRPAPAAWSPGKPQSDNAIPFDWGAESIRPGAKSTITPAEASVFKGIFKEISQDRMPKAKKGTPASRARASRAARSDAPWSGAGAKTQSIVEQAREPELREKFLLSYPPSLREAALVALRLYEREPQSAVEARELDDKDAQERMERVWLRDARKKEEERITDLMKSSQTDVALWQIMEDEIFSMPKKLGILQEPIKTHLGGKPAKNRIKKATEPSTEPSTEPLTVPSTEGALATAQPKTLDDIKPSMEIHGTLYPMLLHVSLVYLDRSFSISSPLVNHILPRIKELGLLSYVLGVSTVFYTRLARMHWYNFGDAQTALDLLQEMSHAGLQADESALDLLSQIGYDWNACAAGAQGPFVAAMLKSPPYDEALTKRFLAMENEFSKLATAHELSLMAREDEFCESLQQRASWQDLGPTPKHIARSVGRRHLVA